MRCLLLFLPIVMLMQISCSTKETTSSATDTTAYEARRMEQDTFHIKGDFNGDGLSETGLLQLIREGEIQAQPWIYTLVFSDPSIQSLTISNNQEGGPLLVNEGNLNDVPGDELSVITQAGMMMMASIEVYSLQDGMWGAVLNPIATQSLLPDSLQYTDLLFQDNGTIFYYEFAGGGFEDTIDAGYYKKKAEVFATIETTSGRFLEEEITGSGDVNGDGVEELLRLVAENALDEDEEDTTDGVEETTTSRLEFSDSRIKPLSISSIRCTGEAWATGDLDGRLGSEVAVMECATMVNYNFIKIYTYKNGHWRKWWDGLRTRDILPEGFDRRDLIVKDHDGVWYYEDEELDHYSKGDLSQMKKTKVEVR